MAKIKMNAPAGVSGMSVAGVQINVVEGSALIDETFVEELKSHGFTVDGDTTIPGSRAERIQLIVTGARVVAESMKDEDLGAFAATSETDRAVFWDALSKGIIGFPKAGVDKSAFDTKAAADAAADAKMIADKAAADAAADAKMIADKAVADAAADAKMIADKAVAETKK